MLQDDWREEAKHIILSPGDMIIDIISNQYGVLVEREQKGSHLHNDLCFWSPSYFFFFSCLFIRVFYCEFS